MKLPIRFLPEAQVEFDDAVDFYEGRRRGLGKQFVAKVREVLKALAKNPKRHGVVYQSVRKSVLRKFPYIILYQEEPSEVLIISVFHCSRDPAIWMKRVRP
jgi:toxin ParE1/3/4